MNPPIETLLPGLHSLALDLTSEGYPRVRITFVGAPSITLINTEPALGVVWSRWGIEEAVKQAIVDQKREWDET